MTRRRRFVDALDAVRCLYNRTLRDASKQQCGRRRVIGDYCRQHAKIVDRLLQENRR